MLTWWKKLKFRETYFRWSEWVPFQRWQVFAIVEEADEVPEKFPRNNVVLVGTKEAPKWLVFDCPCQTGHRIMLNADKRKQPFWNFFMSPRSKLTIYPSIYDRGHPRKCHFSIRSGKTFWTKEVVNHEQI